ncbi:Probable ferredoxin oxidoreductase%2C alpha subunit [Mycobacteroides abscessus]|nr:Probable ferredoxin oxidoreductase%2C alpha subunit [Mycobacteroides abscessus]
MGDGAVSEKLEKVVIRFAGDSGDGMQLTGDRFTSEAAIFGNDLATQPNYPAEIRAPQGTLPGVSSFQIQIADYDILTAGDRPDVLVAMNPAALKANIGDLPRGGMGSPTPTNSPSATSPRSATSRIRWSMTICPTTWSIRFR